MEYKNLHAKIVYSTQFIFTRVLKSVCLKKLLFILKYILNPLYSTKVSLKNGFNHLSEFSSKIVLIFKSCLQHNARYFTILN